MDLKEVLRKIKDNITGKNELVKPIVLDDKVDEYILWYKENMVIEKEDYNKPTKMRNLIEKFAVWYEIRYPDCKINEILPFNNQQDEDINHIMFINNPYLTKQDNNQKYEWTDFFNIETFLETLNANERIIFCKPKYPSIVNWDFGKSKAHIHLTKEGFVQEAELDIDIDNETLKGKHIKEVLTLIKEKDIELPQNNEIESTITKYDNWIYQKQEMLNCIMYRIIERGENRIGPRRALLFAKEFNLNIDIPLIYGIDYFDPGLETFIKTYLQLGGNENTICYIGYHSRTSKYEKLETIVLQEIIQKNNVIQKEKLPTKMLI